MNRGKSADQLKERFNQINQNIKQIQARQGIINMQKGKRETNNQRSKEIQIEQQLYEQQSSAFTIETDRPPLYRKLPLTEMHNSQLHASSTANIRKPMDFDRPARNFNGTDSIRISRSGSWTSRNSDEYLLQTIKTIEDEKNALRKTSLALESENSKLRNQMAELQDKYMTQSEQMKTLTGHVRYLQTQNFSRRGSQPSTAASLSPRSQQKSCIRSAVSSPMRKNVAFSRNLVKVARCSDQTTHVYEDRVTSIVENHNAWNKLQTNDEDGSRQMKRRTHKF